MDASLAGSAPEQATVNSVFVAVAETSGWGTKADLFALQDAADDLVRPRWIAPRKLTERPSPSAMRASTPASYVMQKRQLRRTASTLAEFCSRSDGGGLIGGQEDMIVDIALDLASAG